MKPLDLVPSQAPLVLAALRDVATSDGPLAQEEHAMLHAEAQALGCAQPLEALPDHDPAALAELPAASREALVQRMVIMAMIDGDVHEAEVETLRRSARALSVREPALHQLGLFVRGRMRRLSMDLIRRGFIGAQIRRVFRTQGSRGLFRFFVQLRGKKNKKLAAPYLALAELPEGTLGRSLYEHFRAAGFALPGEAKSTPVALLFHDLGHVLTGYGTNPEGEVQVAGFEAGYMGEDGFGVTLLALFLFHLGADINPTAAPAKGRFELASFQAAMARGEGLHVDLRDWDPWPHMERPLDAVRDELGCPPVD